MELDRTVDYYKMRLKPVNYPEIERKFSSPATSLLIKDLNGSTIYSVTIQLCVFESDLCSLSSNELRIITNPKGTVNLTSLMYCIQIKKL